MQLFLWLLIAGLASSALSQTSGSVVKANPALSVDKVRQGASFNVALVLDIDSGYHVNSNRPSEQFLIGTSLQLERLAGLSTTAVRYPKPVVKRFPFASTPLSVYEGRAILRFSAKASPQLAVGRQTLKGKLRVQACNDQVCLQPKTIEVEIPMEVVPAGTEVRAINDNLFGPRRRK